MAGQHLLVEKGLQAVIDFIRQRNPQTPNVKAADFMDNRYIKELDDSGFIDKVYAAQGMSSK